MHFDISNGKTVVFECNLTEFLVVNNTTNVKNMYLHRELLSFQYVLRVQMISVKKRLIFIMYAVSRKYRQ